MAIADPGETEAQRRGCGSKAVVIVVGLASEHGATTGQVQNDQLVISNTQRKVYGRLCHLPILMELSQKE